jgi:PAS domain S-box-containing protein
MKLNSIQVKLPLMILLGFLLTSLLVQLIVNHNMTAAINMGQEREYSEKLQTVFQTIQANYARLQKTGMVATYQDDFQKATLRQLLQVYHRSPAIQAPFILGSAGQMLQAPPGIKTDSGNYSRALLTRAQKIPSGSFTLSIQDQGEVWCFYQTFAPWGWTVGYLVPLNIKYRMANQLSRILWLVFGGITLLVVLLLMWLVRIQLKPITALTEISAAMAAGNLEHQIKTGRKDEIGILADHFNRMQSSMKQTIRSLQRSEENLRTTLNSIGDAVIATDPQLLITQINPVAEALTGWPAAEALGEDLARVFQIIHLETREPVINPAGEVLASDRIVALGENTLLIAKNGSEHLIADTAAPIRNSEQKLLGVVLVFRDITQERELQEQLLQSRKMDTIGQLAGGVAHDFNNMLGGIIGASELLKRRLREDPKGQKYLGMIMESAERAAALTTKLLSFARKQQINSTPVDVHLALSNALSLLKSTLDRRVQIQLNLAAQAHMVVGDSTQLQNAFLNLCINAAHAMPEGGELSISTQTTELDKIYCASSSFALAPGLYLEIDFRDNGCGIPPKEIGRIFDPFFTTRKQGKGTGLGLAAVLGTVQSHKGEITVYSELGAGTVFHLLLPLTEADQLPELPLSRPLQGSGLILVIDDEAVMRATAGAILEELGYQVLLAENGLAGLELFRENQEKINLVLLDMIMPEMNGRDCFFKIRKLAPKAKILLSSGFTQSKDLSDLRAAGLVGFIRKPFRAAILSQTVAEALRADGATSVLWGN